MTWFTVVWTLEHFATISQMSYLILALRTHLASIMTWDNLDMMAETPSYIFRWCSRCHDTVATFITGLDHVPATGGSFIRYQNTWRYYSKLTGAAKTITSAYEVTDSGGLITLENSQWNSPSVRKLLDFLMNQFETHSMIRVWKIWIINSLQVLSR